MYHRSFGEKQHAKLALQVGVRLEGEQCYELHAETKDAKAFNELCIELKIPVLNWFPPLKYDQP